MIYTNTARNELYIHMVCIPVLRIRIRRIRVFLGLLDPDPESLVRGTDPDPYVIMHFF
jgi:hypothetical protein